jgi:DNA-binding transcriptional LysR family regulator
MLQELHDPGAAMNIQAIRLFLHVIRRGSLAAAAGELNMSPSAASRLLSGLERSTGLKLFSREGQRLRPTAEGQQYYHECHRALLAVDELPRAAHRLAGGAQSRLNFVSGSRLASVLALPTIERFAKSYPDVEINFEVVRVQDVDRIRAGVDFDIALGAPVPTGMPAIEVAPLFEMPATAVMRRDHVLAARSFVRVADLAGHRLIATAMGQAREDLENMFKAEGLEARPHYTVSSIDVGCRLVLGTDAVIIADPAVLLTPDCDSLAVVPLRPLRMIQASMVIPAMKPESRLMREFKNCLREEAKLVEKRLSQVLRKPRHAKEKLRKPR